MTVTDTVTHKISSWNRQIYKRLKLALSLGLRRQIFVAICDDLSLRNRLAGKLHGELGTTCAIAPPNDSIPTNLVSLNINVNDPHPFAQISAWLAQNPYSPITTSPPSFQLLGIERLTRQSPTIQQLFLRRLQSIERYLPQLDANVLLWLPRPWFHSIVQSVPEFWQWHTGVFEFEGEPTPLPPIGSTQPEASPTAVTTQQTTASFQETLQTVLTQEFEENLDLELFQAIVGNNGDNSREMEPLLAPTNGNSGANLKDNGMLKAVDFQTQETPTQPNPTTSQPLSELSQESPHLPADELAQTPSPAEAYLQLGNHYRHAIEQGDPSPENLAIAIQSYEQALQWLDDTSPHVPDVLNDLGNLYWMLSRCPQDRGIQLSYLEQGIQSYQLALTKLTAQQAPQTYAMIQNNLGAAYGDLARYQEAAENLELSIRAYEEALHYRHPENDPLKYASTQNNLGTAYWHLAQHHSPVNNLQAAIGAYAEALCYYNSRSNATNWAMIQNNLGTAYWNLAQYEKPETWLELAVIAYKDALTYRTPEVAPAACAATQNNLGTAYWHLADRCVEDPQRRADYLRHCISAYEVAIALAEKLAQNHPPTPINFDGIATRNNLGLAHYQFATEPSLGAGKEDQSKHLETALHHHVQACMGVAARSDAYQTSLEYIIKAIRTFYQEQGITGQNLALSRIPGQLLPEILPRL
ncbi:tetratricopeptide repeat protein [Coleofasciculus sp. G2-EDA-02]|uniref:tetratricopeptide repeat protein n=1 Tax=Coleofasciculus sp. G2-EDA-02 TaxID=3069529 RepID=UPI0032F94D81